VDGLTPTGVTINLMDSGTNAAPPAISDQDTVSMMRFSTMVAEKRDSHPKMDSASPNVVTHSGGSGDYLMPPGLTMVHKNISCKLESTPEETTYQITTRIKYTGREDYVTRQVLKSERKTFFKSTIMIV